MYVYLVIYIYLCIYLLRTKKYAKYGNIDLYYMYIYIHMRREGQRERERGRYMMIYVRYICKYQDEV